MYVTHAIGRLKRTSRTPIVIKYHFFYLISEYILGQYVVDEHDIDSDESPVHCFPSYFGSGSVHVRIRVFVPVTALPVVVHD